MVVRDVKLPCWVCWHYSWQVLVQICSPFLPICKLKYTFLNHYDKLV